MASEVIEKGHKYRVLKDVLKDIWVRKSFWTSASDVEFDNGKSLQSYEEILNGGGSITLTQAQYDALSDEEKCNGTVYYVVDGV